MRLDELEWISADLLETDFIRWRCSRYAKLNADYFILQDGDGYSLLMDVRSEEYDYHNLEAIEAQAILYHLLKE